MWDIGEREGLRGYVHVHVGYRREGGLGVGREGCMRRCVGVGRGSVWEGVWDIGEREGLRGCVECVWGVGKEGMRDVWGVGKEGMRWCVGCREGGYEMVCGM